MEIFMERVVNRIYKMRFEKKYIIDLSQLNKLRSAIISSKSFRINHAPQIVNNLYYDNNIYKAVHENLLGISNRIKYRIRWYGNDQKIKAKFEKKCRKDMGNFKEGNNQILLDENPWNVKVSDLPNLSEMNKLSALKIKNVNHFSPAVLNRYKREYYINKIGDRLTIDRDIIYRNCRNGITKNDSNIVVELKYNSEKINDGLIDFFNLTISKNSKYVNGIFSTTNFVFE
tara:strand:+ start:1210 stop:1896 length:687 start_codon:yes stop_codon:yes gene_type:complete